MSGWTARGTRVVDSVNLGVCEVCEIDGNRNQAEHRPHLIAAAPDLAEALSALMFWQAQGDYSALPMAAIQQRQKAVEAARAALAKAGGDE